MANWYQQDVEKTLKELDSDAHQGLSDVEAGRRLERFGPNELEEKGGKGPWRILFDQFKETMVVILIIAAVISALLGDGKDAIVIVAIVFLNALLGFRQEYQAEQAMAALKKLAVPNVRVRRNGHVLEDSSRRLVPGDIILLEAGNIVPADARLVESINLRVQEAALTGESEPVAKDAKETASTNLPLADRHNMIYMGTVVTYGRGTAVVTETGMKTELGSIATLMQSTGQDQTPLQRRLDQLGKGLALAAFVLVIIVFILGMVRGEDLKEMILTSISIAVAAVPEGMPAVVTISLALGARRMLRRKALIRKLPAVEGLGSVTVICSDKTGTLTENRMTVTILDVADHRIDLTENELPLSRADQAVLCAPGEAKPEVIERLKAHPALTLLLAGGALCNDALLECDEHNPERLIIVGDPTEGALLVSAARMGLPKESLEQVFPRVAEAPFDSERKRMTTVHTMPATVDEVPEAFKTVWNWPGWSENAQYVAFTKGAIDGLVQISKQVWFNDRVESMSPEWVARIEKANAQLAENGMRVLGVACKPLAQVTESPESETLENDLIFIGLVGMIDPARAEVKDAVRTAWKAGIRPIMITGDHPLTARFIAKELGIDVTREVITGHDLEGISQSQLEETVARDSVYARVSPEHKLLIVQALQNQGHIVAMTGDGVNDAPALKTADIGVAMGITGTDVSKEASDMVLLDDNFATIVAAVEEGRVIYDNIRKFIKYTMTSNTGEIWIMLISPFLGMPIALLPLQILWINLVTDGLPGLALSFEKPERNTMQRPPYPPKENIFARGTGRDILLIGFLMGVLSLGVGYWYWLQGSVYWQTMIFTTIVLSEMWYVLAIRSNRDSFFSIGPFSNIQLIGAVVLTVFLQMAVVYLPFLQEFFRTEALPLRDLGIIILVSSVLFWVVELMKWFIRRREDRAEAID